MDYNPAEIEKKWQQKWEKDKPYKAVDFDEKPKFYGLIEFPYPSGNGLHVGHVRAFTSMEVISRKRRMQGYNVLFPIGFDAFGLPTENYAIKTGRHPRGVTDANIATFMAQLKRLGYSFDYSRVIDTTDSAYYKWTQWIFVKLFKKGLAYKSKAYVNFCPVCKVVLSNEESQGGVCDRCDSTVEQKEKDVWFLKIRDYAESLLRGLNEVDFLPRIRFEQENWIGRSEGAEVDFSLSVGGTDTGEKLTVFTTRPDTLFGVTFMVVAPEHPIIEQYADSIKNISEVKSYQNAARLKNEFERVQLNKEKSGVILQGICAVNPITGRKLPVFAADYVMMGYGTGAIMAVPAHDTRDWEFAHKYNIPLVEVIKGGDINREAYTDISDGVLVNSDFLNGLSVAAAKVKICNYLTVQNAGRVKVNYNMKDWAFNRQRYWGEPIPIVHCPKCGAVPVPERELPLELPVLENYKPTDTGESPLAAVEEWVNCTCPKCKGEAKRETDTMPQWAGSSWYFLRYIDPRNKKELASKEKLAYWGQVDWYNGGMEHVTRHLIYSRFWNHFLHDIGVVPHREPYIKRTAQGLILGEDGGKMAKSRGNVVNPDQPVSEYGADAFRLFMMFIGDYEKAAPWSSSGIKGTRRFLERVWRLSEMLTDSDEYSDKHASATHKMIKKVGEDIESMKFNTAIAAMMEFVNTVCDDGFVTRGEYKALLTMLAPFAPHIASELFELCKFGKLTDADWCAFDEEKIRGAEIELPVQVGGKLRAVIKVAADASADSVKAAALEEEAVRAVIEGKTIVKEIFVPGKILNLIVK